ncbi:MAG TPA: peptide-methionine (S)-S-oxide reductase MsrA [Pyrinomonadaceae bacterium]|nr:peptide-methionine (S)-S-oxide reductase MsrA [Pyrinomonadaceae bacterium]
MTAILFQFLSFVLMSTLLACSTVTSKTPDLRDITPAQPVAENTEAKGLQTAVFAGGCFWGVEAVFEHVKGVTDSRSGYAGGDAKTANYDAVSDGRTQHAESVQVTFDPTKVTYTQLLTVFFSVAHDPTELNRQGPDTGTQYRSAIFYVNDEQKKLAEDFIKSIDAAKSFPKPVVTQVVPLVKFFEAEAYHQNYLKLHPDDPYIVYHDLPKLEELKKRFPELWKD